MSKKRNVLLIILSAIVIFGFSVFGIIKADNSYSYSERRALKQLSQIKAEKLLDGSFMSEFETYSQDQFPFRDNFRSLKAYASKYLFGKLDNNGYYEIDGYLAKLEYPLTEGKFNKNISKINEIYDKYLEGTECSIYLSAVPDKNYYLAKENGYPSIDYDAMITTLKNSVIYDEYIDLTDILSIDNYYRIDQHWKQETIIPAANRLLSAMKGEEVSQDISDYKVNTLESPFYGTYYGQAALKVEADELKYLTNDVLDACTVTSYSSGMAQEGAIYDMSKAYGKDPYEIYLSGSEPFGIIENPNSTTDKELVIFRDSFGGSIAPLLVNEYAKITVIDLRYVNSAYLGKLISFEGQDVLFLYSTLILNNTIYN